MLADRVRMGSSGGRNDLMLYDNGNEFNSKTGGWVEGAKDNYPTVNKDNNVLYIRASYSSRVSVGSLETNTKINLNGYSQLFVTWKNTGKAVYDNESYLYVANNKGIRIWQTGNTVARVKLNNSFSTRTTELDVSSLNGSYYIGVCAQDNDADSAATSELTVYKVWGVR